MYDDGRKIQLDSYQLQLELAYHEAIAMEVLGDLSDQQEPTWFSKGSAINCSVYT